MSIESHSMMDTVSNRMSIVYERPGSDIQKSGYLKKLKTMKKKFFVLRSTSSSGPARLEYYDTEKKFKNNQLPKKIIHLHKCFNINKKSDTRAKNAIALYTNDDCFAVVAESGAEQEDWLRLLLDYQDEYVEDGQGHRQRYDYVWQVTINRKHNKGLGGKNFSVCGQYRVCLSVSQVCLVRNSSDIPDFIFQLSSIRRCGHSDNFFFMEVGRQAPTGAGEILMQVDDSIIAQNMHEVILNAMKSSSSSSHDTFRQRSSTSTSLITRREALQEHSQQASLRPRTGSESRCQTSSPRKVTTRPQSTAFQRSPNTSSEPSPLGHSPNPLSSPHMYENSNFNPAHVYENAQMSMHGHRYRSDSAESHGSRSSIALSVDLYGSSPAEQFFTSHRSVTPESSQPPITEESAYLPMAPGQRSTTPSPPCPRSQLESPGSAGSDAMEITGGVKRDGYIEMKPTGSVGSSGNDSGYMDMVINHHNSREEKVPVENPASYMMMGGHHRPPTTSVAVPLRQAKEGGYMDMAPSSQPLPTVKEGGSGEAYLPMTPTGMSPKSSMELRPAKVISYLSDDSMSGEFPKRAYSVGSRPVSKSARYHQYVQEPPPVDRAVTDNGRSSSAPHLIVQKIKNQSQGTYMTMDSSNLSCSPSVKSDDSDSFMELDFFYRPRTSSDSFGCRPRSSSFGKMYNVTQGHRPRSSSYGQSSRGGKHQAHLGSFESVRTTSKELLYKRSQESLSRFSTTSSKASSSESLRKGTQISDYVDMTANKSRGDASGYIDMTIGATASKSGTSRSSSSQSLSSSPAVSTLTSPSRQDKPSPDIKVIKASGHVIQKPVGFIPSHHPSSHMGPDGIPSQSSLFSPITFANASGGSRSPSVKGRSPASSGKESEEESYVPYEPGMAKLDHSADKGKENLTVREDTKSSKKKKHKDKHDKHNKHGDKGKKSDSGKKSPKMENVAKEQDDTYLEYEPGTTPTESSEPAVPHTYKQMHYSPKSDSRKSIQVSKSVDEKVDHSIKIMSSSVGKLSQEGDNAYMDFNPAASPQKFQDPLSTLNTAKSTLQSPTASNNTLFEPTPQDTDNAVESVQEANDGHQSPPKSKAPAKDESYQYMDFDPATHQMEKDDETSEVKSPTRVRSYIASGGASMDAELGSSSSSSSLSSLANLKGGDERIDDKGLEIAVKSIDQAHEKQNIGPKESTLKKSSKAKWKKGDRKDLEVKKVSVVMPVHLEVDDGYVGLDYSSGKADFCEDGSEQNEVDLLKPLPVKSEISFSSDGGPYKTGMRRMLSSDCARTDEVSERCSENRASRKISAPLLGQYNQKAVSVTNQRMSPARKVSVSSLNEEMGATGVDKEVGTNPDSLRTGVTGVTVGSELQKQNSMPCMTLPVEAEQQTSMAAAGDFVNSPRSRHSCSDLAGAYEQMNFPANNNLDVSHQQSSSQQQLAPPAGPQLNYASLDLGSSENVDDPKSPRIKSRHPSSADETTGPPLSYAEIDFKKSENLKNTGNNKEVTFSLD